MFKEINWDEQWAQHSPEFKNGCAQIPLPTNQKFELLPGPGFGDFSHPTTQLMIELMPQYVRGKAIFDIGCGSGILSIASAKMGARTVHCCDIDNEALLHTSQNARHNGVKISMDCPLEKPVILMNMIASEQKIAWETHQCPFHILITSGILFTDQKGYLDFAKVNGWQLIDHRERNNWMGYIFKEIE